MRESNFTFPPQNRAVLSITHLLYDRRALDTNSPLPLLNNLTSLTYLTSTSPRIRELLSLDGGLERLLDILRDAISLRDIPPSPDLWGLKGPPTARVISVDQQIALRHSLAFQCVVNIGVRGNEAIRTRVVQAGALDLVAQILETWLKQHGVAIFANSLGSQQAVDLHAAGTGHGREGQGDWRRRRSVGARGHSDRERERERDRERERERERGGAGILSGGGLLGAASSSRGAGDLAARGTGTSLYQMASNTRSSRGRDTPASVARQTDTDVDMADVEGDEGTDGASIGGPDDSMEVDTEQEHHQQQVASQQQQQQQSHHQQQQAQPGSSTTPRANQSLLPLMSIPPRSASRDPMSEASSAAGSYSDDMASAIPRATSDNNIAMSGSGSQATRPSPLNLGAARVPQLATDAVSNQSSPMGTPTRNENADGMRRTGRRGTIIARPIGTTLAPRNDRHDGAAGSGTSDGGEDVDLPTATVNAGLAAARARGQTIVGADEQGPAPNVEIVENAIGGALEDELDADALAAEQARLDLEAGAPPGQPGAAQTPRVPTTNETPRQALLAQPPANPQQAQIIIANGAPRGFQDLGSYVGISSLLNPDGDRCSNDTVLLALQLLAYLSKYPHVRATFHHPHRPMHPTFDISLDTVTNPLPERPAYSQTPNIFSLVERFTFRPSPSDRNMYQIPADINYWAGVIMRNACRKDEGRGGIRQCANMSCGRLESFPREFAKCRRCRKAKYCSKECQSKAWSEGHRFWCNTRSDESGPPPPGGGGGGGGDDGGGGGGGADDDDDPNDFSNTDVPRDILSRLQAATRGVLGGLGGGGGGGGGGVHHAAPTPGGSLIPPEIQTSLLDQSLRRTTPQPVTRQTYLPPTTGNWGGPPQGMSMDQWHQAIRRRVQREVGEAAR